MLEAWKTAEIVAEILLKSPIPRFLWCFAWCYRVHAHGVISATFVTPYISNMLLLVNLPSNLKKPEKYKDRVRMEVNQGSFGEFLMIGIHRESEETWCVFYHSE